MGCPFANISYYSFQMTLHLVATYQEQIAKEQVNVEAAGCRLQYLQQLSYSLALQAKVLHAMDKLHVLSEGASTPLFPPIALKKTNDQMRMIFGCLFKGTLRRYFR